MQERSSSGDSRFAMGTSGGALAPNPLQVLVIDEHHDLAGHVRQLMSQAKSPCEVQALRTCEAALEAIRANAPDLLVVGVSRPDSSGLDTCHRLREERCSVDVPILAVSGPTEVERARALDSGADDCVSKSIGGREFAARVRALIRRYVS